jgi:hypothetical protein
LFPALAIRTLACAIRAEKRAGQAKRLRVFVVCHPDDVGGPELGGLLQILERLVAISGATAATQ